MVEYESSDYLVIHKEEFDELVINYCIGYYHNKCLDWSKGRLD